MSRSPEVLLTGSSGFLGSYLLAELRRRQLHVVTAGRRGADLLLDLTDPGSLRAALAAARPDVVLSCAAMPSLSACDADPDRAEAVNARAPALFAELAPRVLQISTDQVFDGIAAPYAASAAPSPKSGYGRSKAAAEPAVVAAGGLVVRLPLLLGRSPDGRRGATDMILAARPGELVLFTNEYRTPLHVRDAAAALVDLVLEPGRAGIVHLPGPERLSRHELGLRFAHLAGVPEDSFQAGECRDLDRPRDVSLCGEWSASRDLDTMLRDSAVPPRSS